MDFKKWVMNQWAIDERVTPGVPRENVDLIIDKVMKIIQQDIPNGHISSGEADHPNGWKTIGDLSYQNHDGNEITSRVYFIIKTLPIEEIGNIGLSKMPNMYAINGQAVLRNKKITVELYISEYLEQLSSPPDNANQRYTFNKDQLNKILTSIKSDLLHVLYHEIGHQERPLQQSNRKNRFNRLSNNNTQNINHANYIH